MSIPSDLYKVLQVDPEAESEVIRAAYRTLAVKYHPDVAPDSQERMAALNHAWGILRDATARARYDEARAETRRHPRLSRPVVTTTMPAPVPASPPGEPSGEVLAFGRYSGWSLGHRQVRPGIPGLAGERADRSRIQARDPCAAARPTRGSGGSRCCHGDGAGIRASTGSVRSRLTAGVSHGGPEADVAPPSRCRAPGVMLRLGTRSHHWTAGPGNTP